MTEATDHGNGTGAPAGEEPAEPAPPRDERAVGEPTAAGRPAAGAAAGLAGTLTADWPSKAADLVDLVAGTLHDKAVRPLVLAARAVVFGILVAALAVLMAVLVSIAVLRLLDVYAFPDRVWLSYVVLGGLLTVVGLGAWSRRTARRASAGSA